MSAPTCAQYGAIEAMRHCDEEIEKMRQAYLARRNFLVKTFNEMGLKTFTPQGAFYVFPCIKSTGLTSEQLTQTFGNLYDKIRKEQPTLEIMPVSSYQLSSKLDFKITGYTQLQINEYSLEGYTLMPLSALDENKLFMVKCQQVVLK